MGGEVSDYYEDHDALVVEVLGDVAYQRWNTPTVVLDRLGAELARLRDENAVHQSHIDGLTRGADAVRAEVQRWRENAAFLGRVSAPEDLVTVAVGLSDLRAENAELHTCTTSLRASNDSLRAALKLELRIECAGDLSAAREVVPRGALLPHPHRSQMTEPMTLDALLKIAREETLRTDPADAYVAAEALAHGVLALFEHREVTNEFELEYSFQDWHHGRAPAVLLDVEIHSIQIHSAEEVRSLARSLLHAADEADRQTAALHAARDAVRKETP